MTALQGGARFPSEPMFEWPIARLVLQDYGAECLVKCCQCGNVASRQFQFPIYSRKVRNVREGCLTHECGERGEWEYIDLNHKIHETHEKIALLIPVGGVSSDLTVFAAFLGTWASCPRSCFNALFGDNLDNVQQLCKTNSGDLDFQKVVISCRSCF